VYYLRPILKSKRLLIIVDILLVHNMCEAFGKVCAKEVEPISFGTLYEEL
jgi:hypothetical protein